MTTTDPVDPLAEEEVDLLPPPGRLQGLLPRLPGSPRTRPSPTPEQASHPSRGYLPPPGGPPVPGSVRSSTGSTEPPKPPEMADPKDFRDAVRAGVDIGFVLVGQFAGSVHARRSGETRDANRWKPTLAERRQVAAPAHRIAKRHIENSVATADAIDVCLMAAGVGAYTSRALFDLEDLEVLDDDDS